MRLTTIQENLPRYDKDYDNLLMQSDNLLAQINRLSEHSDSSGVMTDKATNMICTKIDDIVKHIEENPIRSNDGRFVDTLNAYKGRFQRRAKSKISKSL